MQPSQFSAAVVLTAAALSLAACSPERADKEAGDEAGASAPLLGSMMELKTELPKPLFVGTEVPIQGVPNLEKLSNKPRPPFRAPEGTVNAAAGKKVCSSDEFPVIGDLEMVTDGDKDGADGSYVELGPEVQWVQIDLENSHNIYAILVWHYHMNARAYHDVIAQVSDDPKFMTGVTTIFNNDHDNSAKLGAGKDPAYVDSFQGRLIDAQGVKGRYVRLYSRGNSADEMNHYIEVEVHGKPA